MSKQIQYMNPKANRDVLTKHPSPRSMHVVRLLADLLAYTMTQEPRVLNSFFSNSFIHREPCVQLLHQRWRGVLYKGQQIVELTHILDPMHFKTLLKEISLKLGFDKILYQQNMKCGNSSGKVYDRITYVQEESGFNYCLYSVYNSLLK